MPQAYVKKMAAKHHLTMDRAEHLWDKAKKLATKEGKAEQFDYITGIFKRMVGEATVSTLEVISGLFDHDEGSDDEKQAVTTLTKLLKKFHLPVTRATRGTKGWMYSLEVPVPQSELHDVLTQIGFKRTGAFFTLPEFPDFKLRQIEDDLLVLSGAQETAADDQEDKVCMDVPLLIRLLEVAREDLRSDEELHVMVERILHESKTNECLTMKQYPNIWLQAEEAQMRTKASARLQALANASAARKG